MRVAVVQACRYVADPGGVRLDRQAVVPTDLEPLMSAVNRSFEDSAFPRSQDRSSCPDRPDQARAITRLDVLWLTDASGRSLEVRIVRKPCAEVARAWTSGFTPSPSYGRPWTRSSAEHREVSTAAAPEPSLPETLKISREYGDTRRESLFRAISLSR
ncbi:MAG: hypothetical protein QOE54_1984 [Streptosporangiaceae bacterium]|jgi:hypothetical protein|nr:hypothetical protein [Streptosporangiaceae bacterium]